MRALFHSVLSAEALTSLFQPIVDLNTGAVVGHEGLIRGPMGTPLHSPLVLFDVAADQGCLYELERLCHLKHLEAYARLGAPGRLFLNISPDVMIEACKGAVTAFLQVEGARPVTQIVLELTESVAPMSYEALRDAAQHCRSSGVLLALDDLGEGFSSLRLWSEIKPELVKIDKYFIRDIDADPFKRQFVQAMVELASTSGTTVVAEGIETQQELDVVLAMGISHGQGYLLGRPAVEPVTALLPEVRALLQGKRAPRGRSAIRPRAACALNVLREVPTVMSAVATNEVYAIFQNQPDLQVVAVLSKGVPVGLIHRSRMLDRLARPYQRELYGAKPCAHFIENAPLIVDQHTSLQDLAHLFTENNPHHLFEGFIITGNDQFMGVGTGFDLLREITQLQMDAARHANPLTLLPGNVPVNEHIDLLTGNGEAFAVCYADLDHFKPFNDLYGYRKGDEAIQLTARWLQAHVDDNLDFLGHIGGDDFILVFRSDDWQQRCQAIVNGFAQAARGLYHPEHLAAGGYVARNRQGHEIFHHLLSISLGVVWCDGSVMYSSAQISEFAAGAKSQAKKVSGNALFVERRALPEPAH